MEELKLNCNFKDGCCYRFEGERLDVREEEADIIPGENLRSAFYLVGKKDITLDFGGAMLFLHGRIQPFTFEECENITLRNVIVKFDRSSVTEGEILSRDGNSFRVHIRPSHTYKIEDGKFIPYGEYWENRDLNSYLMFLNVVDNQTRQGMGYTLGVIGKDPVLDENVPWTRGAQKWACEQDGEDVIFSGENIPDFYCPGRTLIMAHQERRYSGVSLSGGKNIKIENYRMINGNCMGLCAIHTENIHIDRMIMTYDELSDGFTTNCADGIHTVACCGEFIIENSILEGMVDDAINIHGHFYGFDRSEGNRIYLDFPGAAGFYRGTFHVGDTVRVSRGKTLEKIADYTVVSSQTIDWKHAVLEVDREVVGCSNGDTVDNLSASCNLTVRNCRIGKSSVSHMRFQNGGVAIFENCETEFPLWLTGDLSYWYEARPVEKLIVKNSRFSHGARIEFSPQFMPTTDAIYYHKDAEITDCTFDTERPLHASFARQVVFCGNTNINGKPMTVEAVNCGEVRAEGCEVERVTKEVKELGLN